MRTNYRIDDYQGCYLVIDNFEQLFDAAGPDVAPGALPAEDGLFDA